MTEYWAENDEYCYDGTHILVNKYDIKNASELERREKISLSSNIFNAEIMLEKLSYDDLIKLPTLQRLHSVLFSSLYDWAGEIRTVRISKENTVFCYPEHIVAEAEKGFALLQCSDSVFLNKFAESFGHINMVHPFRDGNGRTQKWLFDKILQCRGYDIDWQLIANSDFLNACIADYNGDRGEQLYHTLSPAITLID